MAAWEVKAKRADRGGPSHVKFRTLDPSGRVGATVTGKASKEKASKRSIPSLHRVTTESVATRERFEFWRAAFNTIEMSRDDERTVPFRGEMTELIGRGGAHFRKMRVDAVENRFRDTSSEGTFLLVGRTLGRMEVSDRRGSSRIGARDVFLIDTSRDVCARHGGYETSYLKLPRSLVLDAIGAEPLPRGAYSNLTDQGLAPFLSSQLALLSERADELEPSARGAVLEALVDLGLAMLRQRARAPSPEWDVEARGSFAAAKLYIERHFHRDDLTPERIAAALGCSRASLYRLFAERDMGILELVRELRLRRSLELMKAGSLRSIASVAFESGFADLSTFNRSFRRRFGQSPSEWRARCIESVVETSETGGQSSLRRNA